MNKRRIAIALVCLAVAAGLASYYWAPWQPQQDQQQAKGKGKGKGKRAGGPGGDEAVPVLALDARTADVPVYLDGVGTAKALNTVTVRAQVDGKLLNLSFTEGQDVSKGDVLAKIDPTTYQAQYDQAVAKKAQDEAQLANAKLDLERYTRLSKTNAINKQQVDTQQALVNQLEAQVRSDQAAIDNAKAILGYTSVVAPLTGRTGIRMVDEGNIVRGSDATGIVMITQVKPISVIFNLPQQELSKLQRGLGQGPLPIDAIGPDSRSIDKGTVQVIDNQVDQTTGTVKLKAEFPNADLQLWPGQFINVRLLIDTLRKAVVVPTAAIQRGPNGTYVYVVKDDNTVTVRLVSVTQQDDQQAVIAPGLREGERETGLRPGEHVVTTGFARLAEGTKVTVTNAEEAGQIGQDKGKARAKGKRIRTSGETPSPSP
ncbi:MAG: rane fusion protein multidrug efflux system [Alphaproteobacteria bacterium]|jgi:multidrug efflux system membrane fusion protein|nr:rane fusion protein multidrug efflux system [Alphaproteobacteria bacterium]